MNIIDNATTEPKTIRDFAFKLLNFLWHKETSTNTIVEYKIDCMVPAPPIRVRQILRTAYNNNTFLNPKYNPTMINGIYLRSTINPFCKCMGNSIHKIIVADARIVKIRFKRLIFLFSKKTK